MPATEKLLAAWKLCLSLIKSDWELADYPVIVREQKLELDSDRSPSRGLQQSYLARTVNWSVMTRGGGTPHQAMAELVGAFLRIKETRQHDGKATPRPGIQVPIEFAPSNRVNAHPVLTQDFIQRILGLAWAFLSDQSSLWDFLTDDTNNVLSAKIREVYGVDVSDVESGNLAEILERIAARQIR